MRIRVEFPLDNLHPETEDAGRNSTGDLPLTGQIPHLDVMKVTALGSEIRYIRDSASTQQAEARWYVFRSCR